MSQTIDERVVEMRFDNKQFEQGAKETMTTLEKLKASLNMDSSAKSFQNLDKVANSVSLAGIAAGVQALQDRFSTFGIVGMRVIENVTDSLMRMASGAMGYVSDAIVSGGMRRAQNIENAHFQLQALLKDEQAVQAVMADAMASVDGTAYAYDEAAKAASQFAASGMRAGEEMQGALRAITGVAAMTNSEYEGISRIFTTVAGNGRLMGDQLLQLASRGLNAAATIADYYREVQGQINITESDIREFVSAGKISFEDFAAAMDWAFGESAFRANETFTGALSNMRSALARIGAEFFSPLIEQNSDLIMLINTVRERINDIKKALTFDEQRSAISGLTKLTGQTTESFEELFSTIKEQGHVSTEQIIELGKTGVNVVGSITDYINGVTDGTIRSSYATKTAIEEITGGLEISQDKVRELVEAGKIDLAMFQSAMETTYGDQTALSKQFTTNVLNMAKSVSAYLKTLDLSKPLAVVYYGVESIKNVFKGLYSFIAPIGKAFANVFLSFDGDAVLDLAAKIEELTSKFKLSEEGSRNLQDAFEGIFSVVKLVIEGILGLIGVVVPATKPITSFGDLVLRLAGAMGRGLSSITAWISQSSKLNKAYNLIASGVQRAMTAVAGFISNIDEIADYIYNLPFVQSIVEGVSRAFDNLYLSAQKYFPIIIGRIIEFGNSIRLAIPDVVKNLFTAFVEKMKEVKDYLSTLDLTKVSETFHKFTGKLKEFLEVFKGNEGISEFIKNMREYFKEMGESFNFDNIFDSIEKFKTIVGGFVDWLRERLAPLFENVSFGGVAAAAGGFGMIYAIVKITKVLDKVSTSLKAIPNLLGAVKGVLVAYQADLKAEAMLKIAKAITLLAVAITVLSFADTERVYQAVIAIGIVGAALVMATGYLTNGLGKLTGAGATLYTCANTMAKGFNNFTKAIKWRQIGEAIKDMAIAIAIIVASIIILGKAYANDASNIENAAFLIAKIGLVFGAITLIVTILGKFLSEGMDAFKVVAQGVLTLATALLVVVLAVKKLLEIEVPPDFKQKMDLLMQVFLGLAALTVVAALATKIATRQKDTEATSIADSILSMAGALYIMILGLQKLFELELPNDYGEKLFILGALMAGLLVTILAVGAASRLAKGTLKATGTLLAMCAVIVVLVGALAVLSLFKGEKLLSGALTLGIILISLGIALLGAGAITEKSNWKTVMAMALQIGVITASLGVLSMISTGNLVKAATALGSILLILALDLYAASKITDENNWASVLALAVNVGMIALSLYFLAELPWKGLLAGSVALGAVLLALSGSFAIISKAEPDMTSIGAFIVGTFFTLVIAVAISLLADYSWSGILSAATALSAVLVAIGGCFALMSINTPSWQSMLSFLEGVLGVFVIGMVLKEMAYLPWEGMLAAAAAISMTLIAMAIAMAICSIAGKSGKAALIGIGLLDLFIADLAVVLAALGALYTKFGDIFTQGGQAFMEIGSYIGGFIANILGAFTGEKESNDSEGFLSSLGQGLSDFANNASDFFEIVGSLDEDLVNGAKNLAEALLLITATELTSSIFGGADPETLKTDFDNFGQAMNAFYLQVKDIKPDVVDAAGTCAQAMADLYQNMPKEGGWWKRIVGESKSLGEIAQELVPFGQAMVDYSNIVAGNIDKGAVDASIAAAEVLLNFSDKLPNMGGLAQKIFGEQKTLAEYAEELEPFGKAMVKYCRIVRRKIDEDAVKASIAAADIIFAFSDKLPNIDGLVQKIFGEQKTLSQFGEELVPFGKAMVEYSQIMAGLKVSVIKVTSTAIETLITIANGLEGESGLLSIFSRDTNLEDFGKQLVKFGEKIVEYSNKIKDVDVQQLSDVSAEVLKLIDIANLTNELDVSGMMLFASTLEMMGNRGIDAFIKAFGDSVGRTTQAIDEWITEVNDFLNVDMETVKNTAELIGESLPTEIRVGMDVQLPATLIAVGEVCTDIVEKANDSLPPEKFDQMGQTALKSVANGIISMNSTALNAVSSVCSNIVSAFKNHLSTSVMGGIGANIISGLVDGINSNAGAVTGAIGSIASKAISAATTKLQIKSPSRVFMGIGEYISLGLAKGIMERVDAVENATEYAAESTVDTMSRITNAINAAIQNNEDFQPTIRPVLDLSNINEGLDQISSMFNARFGLGTYENAMAASSAFYKNRTYKNGVNEGEKRVESKLDDLLKLQDESEKVANYNTFYIQNTDPKGAAEEIGYVLQRQVERRKARWAK